MGAMSMRTSLNLRAAARVLALAVALAAGAALLAGCADRQSRREYERQLGDVYWVRQGALGEVTTAGLEDPETLAKAQRTIRQAAADMDATSPPAEVQQAHDAYVESLRGLSAMLGKLADCARLGRRDPDAGTRCRREIEDSDLDEVQNDFDEADTIFRTKGYKLPASSSQGTTGSS